MKNSTARSTRRSAGKKSQPTKTKAPQLTKADPRDLPADFPIEFTARNTRLTLALKKNIREKLAHTARVVPDLLDAHVVLAVEKHRHVAEILVRRRRGAPLAGTAWSRDMYRSVAKAIDRIQVQVSRKRDRMISKKRRAGSKLDIPPEAIASEAAASASAAPAPGRVVDERIDRVKPISVDEAILLLEKSRRPFVMFTSTTTGRSAAVYLRPDGRYGLVEPKN